MRVVVLWGMGAIFYLLSTDFCCGNAFQSFGRSNDGNHEINWRFNLKNRVQTACGCFTKNRKLGFCICMSVPAVLADRLINY